MHFTADTEVCKTINFTFRIHTVIKELKVQQSDHNLKLALALLLFLSAELL